MAPPNRTSQRKDIEAWHRLIRGEAHLFRDYPNLMFQQAANQPDLDTPAVAARQRIQEGRTPLTWLEWKNKPQQVDPCTMTLTDHTEQVWGCSFSPDGKLIATASQDCALRLWDADTGVLLLMLDGTNRLDGCAFSPDGRRVMAVSSFLAKVWDVQTGTEVATLAGENVWVQGWSYLALGPRIIARDTSADGIPVRVWDIERGAELLTLSGNASFGVAFAFSPDGEYIVSAEEHRIRMYDAATGAEVRVSASVESTISNCAVSPDGNHVVGGCRDGTLKVWNAQTTELISTLAEHEGSLTACAFSPDSKRIISAAGGWDQRTDIKLWDVQTGSEIATLTGHKDWIKRCAYSPDGRRLVTASNDMTAKIWETDLIKSADVLSMHKSGLRSLEYLTDASRLASGAGDFTVKLWDADTGAELTTLSSVEEDIECLALSRDGERIALASRSTDFIHVRHLADDETIATMPAVTRAITRMQFLPDDDRFLSVDDDGTIRIWSVSQHRETACFGEHRGKFTDFCCSADGRSIVTSSGYDDFEDEDESFGELHVWDTQSGDRINSLLTHTSKVSCCAYSPDGTRIVSGSWDRSLKIWDARSGAELKTLTGHKGAIYSCAYSPDARHIVSASADWTLRIWCPATGRQLAEFGWLQVVQSGRYSPDANLIITSPVVGGLSWNDSIKVWSARTQAELTTFRPGRTISCFALGLAGRRLALGDDWGRVYLLDLHSSEAGPPIATAVRLYRGEHKWDENVTARCDWCGKRFVPPDSAFEAISEARKDPAMSESDSPAESLPLAAWEDSRLLEACPCCGRQVRFNPFVFDNRA